MGEATWSPTPSAPTMAILQKWIAGYVGMPTDDEALEMALAGIRLAIDRLNSRDWNWARVYENLTSDSTVIDYPVPSNFKKPFRLITLDSNSYSVARIPYVPWMSFLEEYQKQDEAGEPCVYTCANAKEYGTVSLDKYPSVDWCSRYPTMRLWYFRAVQYENNDGQPDWPSQMTPYVMAMAEGFMADRYAPQKAAMAYARAERVWNDMVRYDNETQSDWE